MTTRADDIWAFWFGDLDGDGFAAPETSARWFRGGAEFDEEIRRRFAPLVDELAGELPEGSSFQGSPQAVLSRIVVLDQFSRNAFRGTPKMFASDPVGLRLARELVAAGGDRALPTHPRTFAYLPFMHAEDLEMQEACVRLMRALVDEHDGMAREAIAGNLHFAIAHRDIVARFGRFPHRNAVLGRATTPEEAEFLTQPGSSF
jgi:uncharacterized protein (DUF924 family)